MNKDDVPQYTDVEFQTVVSVAGKNSAEIAKAQAIFNQKLKDSKTATFPGNDVRHVGPAVAALIDASNQYWEAIRAARTREDVERAGSHFKNTMLQTGLSLPMLRAVSAAVDAQSRRAEDLENDGDPHPGSVGAQLFEEAQDRPRLGLGQTKPDPNSELIRLAMEATRTAMATAPKPVPPGGTNPPATGPTPGGVSPKPGGGINDNSGQGVHVPTTGELLGGNDPRSPTDAMTDAQERYRNGDVSGAIGDASRAIALGGGAPAYALRGGMLYDQSRFEAANADARQALDRDPRNQEAQALLHFTEDRVGASQSGAAADGAARGGTSSAGAAAGRAFAASPSGAGPSRAQRDAAARLSADQALKSASTALSLRDWSGAMANVERALALNPNDPYALNLRAKLYLHHHDYEKALADEKAALALDPKNDTLKKGYGYAALRGGHYKDALASANELIESHPGEAFGYALRAQAYLRMGDRDAYTADIRRAAELDPYYREAAAHPYTQTPTDSDLVFLFPGEEAPKSAPAPAGRARDFSWIVGASVVGGALLALGLLGTVLKPLKDQVSSVFTRVTRTGPSVGALPAEAVPAGAPAAALIRGQYEITRPIGAGGMGMVFEGTDRSLGRRVAIKKMRDELRMDARERARFVSEAKTVAALHHPNIVDIYSIADEGDDVYLIFEYVDGKTVHELVQASGRLAPDQAAAIVGASAEALEFAHGRGVIHRDMKPSNVMVDAQGRVKVMDFGIARMAKEALTRYSMTNTVVGTPPYMAPEQEQGQVRRESDVYSLAVCAYEMLTGRLPFAGVGGGMSLNKINMNYVPPSKETAGLPPALDDVFARAFQADPEKRYRTPGELASALSAAAGVGARV